MLLKDLLVDGLERVQTGEGNGKHWKVSLETWVDCEWTSSWIHARHVLAIVDFLQRQLSSIVPMRVIQMLTDKCMRLDGEVSIDLRHVHIIDKVDESLWAWWAIVAASLLFQWRFQNTLQHHWRGVKVEGNIADDKVVRVERVQFWLDKYGFTRSRITNEHDRSSLLHQHVHPETDTCGLGSGHHCGLEWSFGIVLERALGRHFRPVTELLLFRLDEVVEHGSSWWELDLLELGRPPLGELDTMIANLILEKGAAKSPDASPDKVQLVNVLWRALGHVFFRH